MGLENFRITDNAIKSLVSYSPKLVRNVITAQAILLFCIHTILQISYNEKPKTLAEIQDPMYVFANLQVMMKQASSLLPSKLLNMAPKLPKVPNMWTPPAKAGQTWIEDYVKKETMQSFSSYSSLLHGTTLFQTAAGTAATYTKIEHFTEIYNTCILFVSSMFRGMKLYEKGQGPHPMIQIATQIQNLRAPQVRNRELIYIVLHFIGLLVSITYTWKSFFESGGMSRFEYFYKYFTYLALFRMIMGSYKHVFMKRKNVNRRVLTNRDRRNNKMAINARPYRNNRPRNNLS